jgi:hypothetical protein
LMNQIEVIAGTIVAAGMFKECARALLTAIMGWCVAEKSRRVTFHGYVDSQVWNRHLSQLIDEQFPGSIVKEKIIIKWERRGG